MRIPAETKLILFDWGDTLVRPPGVTTDEAGHLVCLRSVFDALAADASFAQELRRSRIGWDRFRDSYLQVVARQIATTLETGREHTFEDRFALTFEAAGFSRPLTIAERSGMAVHLGERVAAGCRPIDGAAGALKRLAKRYAVGVLSNYPFPPVVRRSLESLGCRFDPFVISGECGWAKPHRNAFAHCLADGRYGAAEVLFVGDDPTNDIEGASRFGLRTCWIERAGARSRPQRADFSVSGVGELAELAAP